MGHAATWSMFLSSGHEGVGEENVSMTDEELRHNSLYTDILQRSQTTFLLLQLLAPANQQLSHLLIRTINTRVIHE